MAKIIFTNSNEEFEVADGSAIMEICEREGVPFACSEGICGTCAIEIVEGMENLAPFTPAEKDYFGDQTTARLACQCKIKKGTVKIQY